MDGMIVGGCIGLGGVAVGVCLSSLYRSHSPCDSQPARWLKTATSLALLITGSALSVYALLAIHRTSFYERADSWKNIVVRLLLAEICIGFIIFNLIVAISPLLPRDKAAGLIHRRANRLVIVMIVCAVCCGAFVAMSN
jgi:hypothetical protein